MSGARVKKVRQFKYSTAQAVKQYEIGYLFLGRRLRSRTNIDEDDDLMGSILTSRET
jgi:hypothetical protein